MRSMNRSKIRLKPVMGLWSGKKSGGAYQQAGTFFFKSTIFAGVALFESEQRY
jgi:hypothetical protein